MKNNEETSSKAMIFALCKSSAVSDNGNSIISIHQESHKQAAQNYIVRGLLKEVDQKCTDQDDEQCYQLTEQGVEFFKGGDNSHLFKAEFND